MCLWGRGRGKGEARWSGGQPLHHPSAESQEQRGKYLTGGIKIQIKSGLGPGQSGHEVTKARNRRGSPEFGFVASAVSPSCQASSWRVHFSSTTR